MAVPHIYIYIYILYLDVCAHELRFTAVSCKICGRRNVLPPWGLARGDARRHSALGPEPNEGVATHADTMSMSHIGGIAEMQK